MEALRKRAATLLSVGRPGADNLSIAGRDPSSSPDREKAARREKGDAIHEPGSPTSGDSQQSTTVAEHDVSMSGFSHAPVRVLPPWVSRADEDDEEDEDDPNPSSQLMPLAPNEAHAAQHNHTPAIHAPGFLMRHKSHEPGRRHDARRGSEAPTPRYHYRQYASRWKQFAEDSEYPRNEDELHQLVDDEFLIENGPDFTQNFDTEQEHDKHNYRPKKRRWYERAERTVLRSAFIPLLFRTIVFCFCIMALALGGSIYNTTRHIHVDPDSDCNMGRQSLAISPLMAIIVDTAAVIYLFFITWDEYRGLPLGLRSGKVKVSMLLFDLFFMIFSAANLTLAFEGLTEFTEACQAVDGLRKSQWKQEYLASVLLIALIAWLMTFAVSILRVVERVER